MALLEEKTVSDRLVCCF